MVRKTKTKTAPTKLRETLKRAEGELTKNEENILRMVNQLSVGDDEVLDFGENLPLGVKQKLAEIELGFFRSEEGIAALRKMKIISRLKKLAREE